MEGMRGEDNGDEGKRREGINDNRLYSGEGRWVGVRGRGESDG